jgi:hypothetical protein
MQLEVVDADDKEVQIVERSVESKARMVACASLRLRLYSKTSSYCRKSSCNDASSFSAAGAVTRASHLHQLTERDPWMSNAVKSFEQLLMHRR